MQGNEGINKETYLRLMRLWRCLGVGYSSPEVLSGAAQLGQNGVDPEAALISSLPYLLYDGAMFGLVLGCLSLFSDLLKPRRLIFLYPQFHGLLFSRPDSPQEAEELVTSRQFDSLRALVSLYAISRKLASSSDDWSAVEHYARASLPNWLVGDLHEGRMRLWGAERERDVRMMILTSAGAKDPDLGLLGIHFPVLSFAHPKKLRDRALTIEENYCYQQRLEEEKKDKADD